MMKSYMQLALPRDDEDFRLEVDRALSHIYRSAEIGTYSRSAKMSRWGLCCR
jgi:hypothetical protein